MPRPLLPALLLLAPLALLAATPAEPTGAPPATTPATGAPTTGAPATAPKTPPRTTPTKPKTSSSTDTTVPTRRPPDVEVGLRLWKQSCWQCHGDTGAGDGPAASALIGGVPPIGSLEGGALDALVKVVSNGRGRMPAYSEDIDRHDARRILVYLREKRAGRAPAPGSADDDEAAGEEGGG
jgi:mono/diheme cytochrome c family protein